MSLLLCKECGHPVELGGAGSDAVVACSCGNVLQFPAQLRETDNAGTEGRSSSAGIIADPVDPTLPAQTTPRVIKLPERLRKLDRVGQPVWHYHSKHKLIYLGLALLGGAWFFWSVTHVAAHGLNLRDADKLDVLFQMGPLLGLLMVGAALWLVFNPVDVLLCSRGLIHLKRAEGRVVLWNDVVDFSVDLRDAGLGEGEPVEVYQFELKHGDSLELFSTHFHKGKDLGDRLRQMLSDSVHEEAASNWESAKDLDFGSLQLSSSGLRRDGQLVPWEQFGMAAFSDDRLVIHMKEDSSPSWEVSMATIQNGAVLLAMLKQRIPVSD